MADEKNLPAEDEFDDVDVVESDKAEVKDSKAKKADKSGKPAKKKGPGFGPAAKKFFRDLKGEFKKIIWPTKKTIIRNTTATIAMCVIIGVFVGLFDLGLSALIKLMLSIK